MYGSKGCVSLYSDSVSPRNFRSKWNITVYQPIVKHLLRKLSLDSIEKNTLKNFFHINDGIAMVNVSKSMGRSLLKCFTSTRANSPLKIHNVFDNHTDNQTFSLKKSKGVSRAADEGKHVAHWRRLSRNPTGRRLQRFFKEQFKQGRSHQ